MQIRKILSFLLLLLLVFAQTENLAIEEQEENDPIQSEVPQVPQSEELPETTQEQTLPEKGTNHYPCIIVGAGISGIAASTTLSDKGIVHLMLQAKGSIGGRIVGGTFAGLPIDLGANFVHDPETNILNKLASELGIGQIPADFHLEAPFYPNNSLLDSETLSAGDALYQTFKSFIEEQKSILQTDTSLDSLLNSYATSNFVSGPPFDRLYQNVQVQASENGADLSELSSFQFKGGNKVTVNNDYVPSGGWAHFLQTIYNSWCTPDLKLNEVVTSIDYSGDKIIVSTNRGQQYTTNHLLFSPSLGTLKANTVPFTPSLPSDKINAINDIGFGRFEKLFVVFKERFWPEDKRTLHFIGKDQSSRYVEAWTVPNDQGLNLVVFFVTGSYVSQIASWQDSSIAEDLASFLNPFLGKSPEILQIFMTRWISDPLTRGAYSFEKVGTTKGHFEALKAPIIHNNNTVHLIGEHTSPSDFSYAQGAYESGESAALDVLSYLSK